MVGEAGLDGERDEDEECLCFSGNKLYVDIYYAFLDYRPRRENDNIVEESIMHLTRLDAWVALC